MPQSPTIFELTIRYWDLTKTVLITVVDPENPIEEVKQDGNSVVIVLPDDATGNVTVTIGDKNYTGKIENGTAVVDITDLPNGTYDAVISYGGDGNYSPITQNTTVTVKDSNVTVLMEVVGEITGRISETLQIPVLVHTSLGDLLSGDVRAYGVGFNFETTVKLNNGVAIFNVPMPDYVTTVNVMFIYGNVHKTVKITVVDPAKPIGDVTQPDEGSDDVVIKLPDDATGNVTVVIDGKNYTATVINGSAVVSIKDLPNGTYSGEVIYSGDNNYSNMTKIINIIVKNSETKPVVAPVYKLTGNNINVIYSGNALYKVLVTKDGKAVGAGESVTINFNGRNTVVKTDGNGYATFKINTNIKPKTYVIKASVAGASVVNKVKVNQIIKAPNKKVKKSKKVTKIKITLKKVNGKALKNKKIIIKLKNKKYKVKTNKKGVAVWKVKKSMLKKFKVGKKVKYTVTYGKAKLTKKLTIKK